MIDFHKKIFRTFDLNVVREQTRTMTQEDKEKRRQETLRKMRVYKLHVSEVDILEEAGEL